MIRIPQHNDWVIFLLLGCLFLFVFMLRSLKRDSSILEFLQQQYEDSANNFLSGIITMVVFCLLMTALIAPNIPVVPSAVTDYHLLGYEINKFGFTLGAVMIIFSTRTVLSYLFFASTGAPKRWDLFSFVASKYYFCFSIAVMVLCIGQYYFNVDRFSFLNVSFYTLLILFLFKLIYYFLQKEPVLPQKWYYKFLYICTLQIVPVLVLWKILFI